MIQIDTSEMTLANLVEDVVGLAKKAPRVLDIAAHVTIPFWTTGRYVCTSEFNRPGSHNTPAENKRVIGKSALYLATDLAKATGWFYIVTH